MVTEFALSWLPRFPATTLTHPESGRERSRRDGSRLRASVAARAGSPGTPAETEQLDLLDGIIVALVRGARKAARAAAKRLGTPALTADFELTKLYGPKTAAKPAPPVVGAPPVGGGGGKP